MKKAIMIIAIAIAMVSTGCTPEEIKDAKEQAKKQDLTEAVVEDQQLDLDTTKAVLFPQSNRDSQIPIRDGLVIPDEYYLWNFDPSTAVELDENISYIELGTARYYYFSTDDDDILNLSSLIQGDINIDKYMQAPHAAQFRNGIVVWIFPGNTWDTPDMSDESKNPKSLGENINDEVRRYVSRMVIAAAYNSESPSSKHKLDKFKEMPFSPNKKTRDTEYFWNFKNKPVELDENVSYVPNGNTRYYFWTGYPLIDRDDYYSLTDLINNENYKQVVSVSQFSMGIVITLSEKTKWTSVNQAGDGNNSIDDEINTLVQGYCKAVLNMQQND